MERTVRVREGETLVLEIGDGVEVAVSLVDDDRVRVRCDREVGVFVRRRPPRAVKCGDLR